MAVLYISFTVTHATVRLERLMDFHFLKLPHSNESKMSYCVRKIQRMHLSSKQKNQIHSFWYILTVYVTLPPMSNSSRWHFPISFTVIILYASL